MTADTCHSESARLPAALSEREFQYFQKLIFTEAGIHMPASKRTMVAGRLAKRLKLLQLLSYGDYYQYLKGRPEEIQTAVDLLTTNETYFFREPKHFDFLREQATLRRHRGELFRVWSAACSSGEEPYSVAMVLTEALGDYNWEVIASDISTEVLDRARAGSYSMSRAEKIPEHYLKKYCLRGVGSAEGTLLVDRQLRQNLTFRQINLNAHLPSIGLFDMILLRNVMIYFNAQTKQEVVARLACRLKPGGYLVIGHSETLNGFQQGLTALRPSIYQAAP
jgi:chemotaxis protein methyltransferase CheR